MIASFAGGVYYPGDGLKRVIATQQIQRWGIMTLVIAGLALAALTGFLVWAAADRLWQGLVIAALAVAFLPLVAGTPTGDVSRILPAGTFAHGIEGKDQIAMASMAATVLLAVMLAACVFGAAKAAWRRLRR